MIALAILGGAIVSITLVIGAIQIAKHITPKGKRK